MLKRFKQYLSGKSKLFIVSMVMLLTVSVGGTLGYIIDQTDWLTNIFKSGLHPEGDLIIKKDVEYPFGENYQIPNDLSFDFLIDFGSDYEGTSVIVNGELTTVIDHRVEVQVKANSQVKVEDILAGTTVKVKETLKPGFSEKDGHDQQSVEITKNETQTLTFTNVYNPNRVDPVNVSLQVEKKLEGDREWIESDKFTFNLEVQKDDLTWEILSSKDATMEHKIVDFTDVLKSYVFDSIKTYSFRISEVKEDNNGIVYDQVKYFDVIVNDQDMDGFYEIENVDSTSSNSTISFDNNEYLVNMIITNIYQLEGESTVLVDITKEVENLSGGISNKDGYVFVLYDEQGVEVKRSQPTSKAGEAFIELTYIPENVGNTYKYTLKELNAGETIESITYDSTVYDIQVHVIDQLDGTIKALFEDDTELKELTFTNIYQAEKNDPLVLEGTKELEGRDIINKEFEFELYETGDDYDITDLNPIQTVKNNSNTFAFDGLSYDRVGTHYYVVKEKDTNKSGVTYDKQTYQVKVNILDQNGKLVVDSIITNEYKQETNMVFKNTYVAKSTNVNITGVKKLERLELKEDMFTFKLYKADKDYKVLGEIDLVKNDVNGNFTFKTLDFDKEGTYYYVVKEDSSNPIDGVTYDDKEYQVKIEVKDDKNGQLVANIVSKDIVFNNTYSPKNTNIVIDGQKVLDGYTLESNMFTFELYEDSKLIQSTTNKEDGTFVFDSITYSKEGTYTYVVKEKKESSKLQEFITFDESEYKVVVEVKDVWGQLVATPIITKEDKVVEDIIFTNVYTPQIGDVVVSIDINKTVISTNKKYQKSPEGFKFVLKKNGVKVTEVTSDAFGQAFIDLTFTKDDAGVHEYELSEVNDGQKYVRYSTDVFKIKYNVELRNHEIFVSQLMNNKVVSEIECPFVNTYYKGSTDTGDSNNIFLYASVSAISIVVLAVLLISDRKRKN